MKIHEYQARELFAACGVPVLPGVLAENQADAAAAARELGGPVVVKAQVLTGGRGKAGGVELAATPDEAERAAGRILGSKIKGIPVNKVLVTKSCSIDREYYVAFTINRSARMIECVLSSTGGVDIEETAARTPEAIRHLAVNPIVGLEQSTLDAALESTFPTPEAIRQAREIITNMYRLFRDKDCSLVEINPLALTNTGDLKALDAKIIFDDNATVRHPDIEALRNREEYGDDELDARAADLSFVSLDGDIGCMVNGAGLAMATADIIQHLGGSPANFLDVGGSSSPEKVLKAFEILLRNPELKAILVNIFGGITRCDDIARGILAAREQLKITVPVVTRLVGTNEDIGKELLANAGISSTDTMTEGIMLVIDLAGGDD